MNDVSRGETLLLNTENANEPETSTLTRNRVEKTTFWWGFSLRGQKRYNLTQHTMGGSPPLVQKILALAALRCSHLRGASWLWFNDDPLANTNISETKHEKGLK